MTPASAPPNGRPQVSRVTSLARLSGETASAQSAIRLGQGAAKAETGDQAHGQ